MECEVNFGFRLGLGYVIWFGAGLGLAAKVSRYGWSQMEIDGIRIIRLLCINQIPRI